MARPEKRMRKEPEKKMRDHWIARAINRAWRETGWGYSEAWFRYKVAGGEDATSGQSGFKSWLYGWTIPDVDQYLIVARTLNGELERQGKEQFLLPLFEETLDPRKAYRVKAA